MPEDLLGKINLALIVLLPALGFLWDLRYRVAWVREAENIKDMVQRVLRATLVLLLHLVALCLFTC